MTKYKGIVNIGNTCYMNAVFQCLFTNSILLQSLLKTHRKSLTEELLNRANDYHSNKSTPLDISSLKNIIDKKTDLFKGLEQQDSLEFIEWFLDAIHNEIKTKINVTLTHNPPKTVGEKKIYHSHLSWKKEYSKGHSSIVDLFHGQYQNRISCMSCGSESYKFEPFITLHLPLNESDNPVNVVSCIKEHLSKENLLGIKCKKCKTDTKHQKQLSILRFPKFLIVSFKRYSSTNKINTNVVLPLNIELGDNKPHLYKLNSLINHHGNNLYSGHYTSILFKNDTMHFLNDENVKTSKIKGSPISDNVYIAFYSCV
jgi:ubiquitin C-terminal hydrolase